MHSPTLRRKRLNPLQKRSFLVIGLLLLVVGTAWIINLRKLPVRATPTTQAVTDQNSWLAGANSITITPETGWSVQQNTPKTSFSLTTDPNSNDVSGRIDFAPGEVTETTDGSTTSIGSRAATMWLDNDSNMSVADVDYLRRWYSYQLSLDGGTSVKVTVSILAPATDAGQKLLDSAVESVQKMLANATIK